MTSTATAPVFSPSLEGVVVGETLVSHVDGEQGALTYRGHDITTLIDRPILDVAWLLLFGDWPDPVQAQQFAEFTLAHNRLTAAELQLLHSLDKDLHPMLVLQAVVPTLQYQERTPLDLPDNCNATDHGLVVAAKIPALLAAWLRLQKGLQPVTGIDRLDPNESFLWQLHGAAPDALAVQTLNATQVLQMEHGYNASTFAGRVCASTNAPIQSVLSASIGTLFGSLHGGADQAALEMAQAIGAPENAAAYVAQCMQNKTKIMGMGHREYKTLDPRAAILKPMAADLCNDADSRQLFGTLVAVEHACQQHFAKSGKQIWANVEFYKGAVFHALGIPVHFFTGVFAMARVYGYIAHYAEFMQDPRLIRPRARYIGVKR
ncbi:MAG: citrate/2-methylcitrate synthase [Pseudomonadales bacterium]